jgi:peroxiredoxin (alkyl hydroperoxide reductase subunit C)
MECQIGKKAYVFNSTAVVDGFKICENFSLSNFIGDKEVFLIFFPKSFTYICPTELFAYQNMINEFKIRNVQLIGCSTDSSHAHLTWLKMKKEESGINGVNFPIVSDQTMIISQNYGVLDGSWIKKEDKIEFIGNPFSHRANFFIDKDGIIRYYCIQDSFFSRSVKESLRIIDIFQHSQKHQNELCPANWEKGGETINPTIESVSKFLNKI